MCGHTFFFCPLQGHGLKPLPALRCNTQSYGKYTGTSIEFPSSPSEIKIVGGNALHSFLIRKLFFQAQAEYS